MIHVFMFYILDNNYLFSSFIYLIRINYKRWFSWNSFSSFRVSFLIIMYDSHVLCLYSSHLIKSLNYVNCTFHFMLLIESTKYESFSFSIIIDYNNSTCLLIKLFFDDCNKLVWNIRCTFISDNNSSSYV